LVPLYAAGYLAPEREYGAPGFVTVVQSLVKEWDNNREAILQDTEMIRDHLRSLVEPPATGIAHGRKDPRKSTARVWTTAFDEPHGGFGRQSKFLLPNVLSFLLHQGVWRRDTDLLEKVFRTLDQMAAGGVRDQLGGAFHRYAVDRFWQVPHFEIMLNENALLARLYLEAYQASGKARYAAVARGILEDLLSRFRLPDGGFASSLDAETEDTEGFYYTWTAEEVKAVLGAQAAPFIEAYLDSSHGLVRGRSVLRLLNNPEALLRTEDRLVDSRSRLLDARARRDAPRRDDKILTSWNALAVSTFAKAAQVLEDGRYLKVAEAAIRSLLPSEPYRLRHSRRAGKAAEGVFLDDYAFLVQALLDLYEADFQARHLDKARELMQTLIEWFQEKSGMPFRFTPLGHSSEIPVQIILNEEGTPSGNAAALIALHRLVLFGAEAAFESQTRAIAEGLGRYLEVSAPSATGLLRALDFKPDEAHEIIIVGRPNSPDTRSLLREIHGRLLHGTVLAVIAPDSPQENEMWPLLAGRPLLDDKATAYVCRKRLCNFPVDTPAQLAVQLDKLVTRVPVP
jgi:uncharacterized protein YyaL (SSP411 family)